MDPASRYVSKYFQKLWKGENDMFIQSNDPIEIQNSYHLFKVIPLFSKLSVPQTSRQLGQIKQIVHYIQGQCIQGHIQYISPLIFILEYIYSIGQTSRYRAP